MPRATCPSDPAHDRFITTAHVQQDWLVDKDGNFIQEIATLDTTYPPTSGNIWTCEICGADAQVADQ